jgi:DNA-binding MarR family transcriptional regulator
MNPSPKEIEILESLYHSSDDVRQRDLAHVAGLSLGMTNAILKRLANKGWITIRKVNNRNLRYAVTPDGMDVIMRRSYRYFRRTIKNVVYYRRAIEQMVHEVKERGYEGLLLVGASDLDFIVEHACRRCELPLLADDPEDPAGVFFLYSEKYIPDDEQAQGDGTEYLQRLLEAVEG